MGQRNYKPRHQGAGRTFNGRKHIDNLYDSAWEKYRHRFLAKNNRCYRCGSPATVVDHLIPHKGDQKLFEKTDNHIPLCKSCHDQCTGYFDRKYKVGSSIKDKVDWMKWRRAALSLTFKVIVLPNYREK